VLAIVPDQRDLDSLWHAAVALIDESSVVALSAGLGPAARYRRWLAALRGSARVVIGTRSAVFAPVTDLGLVMVWSDADD
ncbi:primosome assembly protein PriA, partial [Mycobacterium kansasii]